MSPITNQLRAIQVKKATSIEPAWDSDELFPMDEFNHPTIVQGRNATAEQREIERCLRAWSPYSSALAGGYGGRLRPPVCVDSMREIARKGYLRRYAFAISIWIMAALFATFHARQGSGSRVGWVALLLATYFALDYFVLAQRHGLEQRTRFIHWLKRSGQVKRLALYATLAAGACGLFQVALAHWVGGTPNLIRAYGLLFEGVDRGQVWRLITGPYLHADVAHFIGNASLFVPAFVVARLMAGRHAIYVFVLGNVLTASFAWWNASGVHEAFAGVSGGIMALLGLATVSAFNRRAKWPRLMFVNLGALSVLSLAMTCFLNSAALLSTHLAGLAFGVFYGLMHAYVSRGESGS